MSLFTKTIYAGMSRSDAKAIAEAFENIVQAVLAHKKRIEELEAEVARMKREPRQSLAAKIRSKT